MTAEQLKKIAWLNRAFHADKKAKALEMKLERDRSLAQRITRNCLGMGRNSSGNSTEDALIRLSETNHRTQEKLKELYQIREEITAAIMQIDDADFQTILVWHYLNYLTFEQIAEKMHYDKRTIQRKHKAALDKTVIECHPEM